MSRIHLSLVLLALSGCAGGGPLKEGPLQTTIAPLTTDQHLALARTYAPWILHAVHPERGRQDLPTRVDFDGDLRGDNNWDHMARFRLPPTVYYAVLETETHWFLTYHLFHPRDWSHVRIGFNETHENDGENLQVVVDKQTRLPVLLTTQAHYFGSAHAAEGAGFGEGDESLGRPLIRLDAQGRPSPTGTHAAVYVQAYGHGIYAAGDPCQVQVAPDGRPTFADGSGIALRPARPGEAVAEPDPVVGGAVVPYQLESTLRKLWPGVRDGSLVGEDRLFDGAVRLERGALRVDVPRYYEADRFSGIFGSDRGISPFAFGFSFWSGQIGALFFDPAGRYPEVLGVPRPWATRYLDDPFAAQRRSPRPE